MEVRADVVSRIAGILAALLFVALATTGCSVGEYGTASENSNMSPDAATSQNNAAGEASFNSMVKPLVTNCVSCHGGGTPPNLTSFAMLQAKYKMKPGSTNILVTKGNHSGIQYLSAGDATTVKNWIDSL